MPQDDFYGMRTMYKSARKMFGQSWRDNTVIGLTELGKRKADTFAFDGAKGTIITAINEDSPCTIKDIAEKTRMRVGKVKLILKALGPAYIRQGPGEDE